MVCEKCTGGYYKPVGIGLERVEQIVHRIFPEWEAAPLEQATAATRIGLIASSDVSFDMIRAWEAHVCFILDADSMLSSIDYEATYRTFLYCNNLALAVKEDICVFTHDPDHYIWKHIHGAWQEFYGEELSLRKKLEFPPYGRLLKVMLKGKTKKALLNRTQNIYNSLNKEGFSVFGPFEETPFKVRDNFRYSVIAKFTDRAKGIRLIDTVLSRYRRSSSQLVAVIR